jgi:hypothetical protein
MLPVEQTQNIPFASLPFLFGLENVKTPCSPGINFIWEVPGAFTMFKDFIVPSHTAIFNLNYLKYRIFQKGINKKWQT